MTTEYSSIEKFKQDQVNEGVNVMSTFISFTTHIHNESIASELKSFLVDGIGFEQIEDDFLSDKFSIPTEKLVSLLKNDSEVSEIYNELVMQYLGSYMPNFKITAY